MAKLSELVEKVDNEAREGNRKKALLLLDKLLEKVPDNKQLLARKAKYSKEYEYEKRIIALEEKYGIS
ncbi:MAG: hypothetical protein GF388_07820 [Candidatus Aegiribacteria sp.]|nr:hypothetical protein [Candidatus Aegiribacteria sp.]MBD3295024.1 hypothetical protein [Candidatus Fermentibacteria bacterium]